MNLASDGMVWPNPGVAVGDELEINGGAEFFVLEECNEIVDDEIGAIRAQRLVVESERDVALLGIGN